MEVSLKYGLREIKVKIPQEKLIGVFTPREIEGVEDTQAEIRRALKNPISSKRLKDIIKIKDKIAIVIDDITRPLPSKDILPPLINELTSLGIREKNITIIIAVGLHRPLTNQEITELVGKEITNRIKVINHNPYSKKELIYLSKTSRGSDIYINKTFVEADFKILVGDIEYHQFFGYGGGAKSIHPGIADAESIRHIHSQLDSSQARGGILKGNPMQEELREVIRMTGVDFILNVVLNSKKEIVRAFAGNIFDVFYKGAKLVDEMYKVKIPQRADTVIASCGGFPRDIDLYQSQKAIESAKKVVKQGGKVVLFAQCQEDWGSKIFQEWMKEAKNPEEIVKRIKEKFIIGGHKAYLLAREVQWAKVYLYSEMNSSEVKDAFLCPLTDLKKLNKIIKEAKEIIVLPYATITLPWVEEMKKKKIKKRQSIFDKYKEKKK